MTERRLRVPLEWRAHTNPWVKDEEIAELLILRGAILWSYAHAEQVLTEIMIRCARHPSYREVSDSPPFSLKARLRFMRTVLNSPGPLAPYRCTGLSLVDRLADASPTRNRMAHADMAVVSLSGREFREIVNDGGALTYRQTPYWGDALDLEASQASRLSRHFQKVLWWINARRLLPPLAMDE